MLEAFDLYVKYVPEAPELATIKYRRALIYYEYNHLDQAIPLFKDLAENDPKNELALYAANLLLDCLANKIVFDKEKADDYIKLMEVQVDKFLTLPELTKDPDFASQLGKIVASLRRRRCGYMTRSKEYRAAGALYLKLAEKDPTEPKLDELLYNAALNFGQASLIGRSIETYDKLIRTKPESPLAGKALYRLGQAYQRVGAYREAADQYEAFSNKFPGPLAKPDAKDVHGRIDAPTALQQAAFFRRGLGQTDQAIADVNQFLKSYGGQKEFFELAAGMFFDLGPLYEQRKDYPRLQQNYTEYLRRWAPKGGVDRQIIAEVKLGELAWRSSCPVVGVHGACLDIKREQASSAKLIAAKPAARSTVQKDQSPRTLGQCGPATKSQITVYSRKPELVQQAMAHFKQAIGLYKGGAAIDNVPKVEDTVRESRIAALTYHVALARMAQGDQLYEELLNLKIPPGLVFDPRSQQVNDAAVHKFQTWLARKNQLLGAASKQYQDVIRLKNAHWLIAATARLGQLYQDFANGLYTAPIPTPPAPPAGRDLDEWQQRFRTAYCDRLTDTADSLETKAVQSLSTCLSQATELGWFNEWSRLCELELNQLKPGEYPLASEIRPEPGYNSVPLDVAPPDQIVTAEQVQNCW